MPRSELTGTRIRERRLARKMRQADLARATGISASYLNLIEHNKRRIAGKLLADIAAQLDADYAELVQGADQALLDAVMAAGAANGLDDEALTQTEPMIRTFPQWGALIAAQAERVAQLERSVDALNDRLVHDPALAEAMHEVLSTVSAVRSTASILASTPEIDPNWLGRFHTNLDQDSKRLADGAEAMVSYFEQQAKRGSGFSTPVEGVADYIETLGPHFPTIEAEGTAAIAAIAKGGPPGPQSRSLLQGRLTVYAEDAAALPLGPFVEVARALDYAPLDIAARTGAPLARVLRRLASLPRGGPHPDVGLLIVDGAGAAVARRSIEGFTLPLVTAACPLWPVYQALSHPHYPIRDTLETPDGSRFEALAIATPEGQSRPGQPDVVRAAMLLRPAASTGKAAVRPVGTTCRICPRPACPARREPSLLETDPADA